MKIVDQAGTVAATNIPKVKKPTCPFLFGLLIAVAGITAAGCAEDNYGPGYYSGYRPYGSYPYGYPGYGYPGYGYPGYGYPGSVVVEIGDRPYYTRGPGYYVGHAYYVWKPGHWVWRNGHKVWVHGKYVLRA